MDQYTLRCVHTFVGNQGAPEEVAAYESYAILPALFFLCTIEQESSRPSRWRILETTKRTVSLASAEPPFDEARLVTRLRQDLLELPHVCYGR